MNYMSTVNFGYLPPNINKYKKGLVNKVLDTDNLAAATSPEHYLRLLDNQQQTIDLGRAINVRNPYFDMSLPRYSKQYKLIPERPVEVIESLDSKGRRVAKGLKAEVMRGGISPYNSTSAPREAIHPRYLAE